MIWGLIQGLIPEDLQFFRFETPPATISILGLALSAVFFFIRTFFSLSWTAGLLLCLRCSGCFAACVGGRRPFRAN